MLRSIRKAFDVMKQQDNETSVTVHAIRIWCKEGKVKCLNVGTKQLVDLDSLLDYISMKNVKEQE